MVWFFSPLLPCTLCLSSTQRDDQKGCTCGFKDEEQGTALTKTCLILNIAVFLRIFSQSKYLLIFFFPKKLCLFTLGKVNTSFPVLSAGGGGGFRDAGMDTAGCQALSRDEMFCSHLLLHSLTHSPPVKQSDPHNTPHLKKKLSINTTQTCSY